MRVEGYSAEQIRAAEAPLLAAGEPLMQRAASGLAREISSVLRKRGVVSGAARILLLVGSGNNGGDGLFAAAELATAGATVSILAVGSSTHEAGLAEALAAGCRVLSTGEGEPAPLAELASAADVVVDAILGTGASAKPALRGRAREAVAAILPVLESPDRPAVVAVDIPSGIGPNDGTVPDPVVLRADLTVTFGGIKAGLLLAPASDFAGRVVLIDIGLGLALAGFEPVVRVETP